MRDLDDEERKIATERMLADLMDIGSIQINLDSEDLQMLPEHIKRAIKLQSDLEEWQYLRDLWNDIDSLYDLMQCRHNGRMVIQDAKAAVAPSDFLHFKEDVLRHIARHIARIEADIYAI